MYANAACYTSSSTHLNYQSPTSSFEDDYRGCSPFNYPKYDDQWHCEEVKARLRNPNSRKSQTKIYFLLIFSLLIRKQRLR